MNPWQKLEQELKGLDQQIAKLQPVSLINHDFVLDWAKEGDRIYHRMREKKGDRPGPVKRMINKEHYNELRKQIANGRQLLRLQKQRDRLIARMDAIGACVAKTVKHQG